MNNIWNLAKLSFFTVSKYTYEKQQICDFREIPRPHYCMGLILEGTGEFQFKNKTITVNKGDIIFVPIGSKYISRWSGSPDVLYISAHFSFDVNRLFPRRKKLKIQKVTLNNFDKIKMLYTEMYDMYNGEKQMQLLSLGTFYNILSLVYPNLKYSDNKEIDLRIEKAVDFIEQNYKEKISIDDMAKMCCMSASHFHNCFRECMGVSPIEYKLKISIRNAQLMLIANKEKSIEEISELTGFNSSIYFRKVFKEITGMTPREYRKISIE